MIVLDIETTGLSINRDHIVEIALVTINEGGLVVDEWSTRVRSIRYDEDGELRDPLTRIHGITAQEAAAATPWSIVGPEIAARLNGQVIVGHNVTGFDIPFLRRALERLGITLRPAGVIDTLVRDRVSRYTEGRHTLGAACDAWGIPLTKAHNALADARATAQLAVGQSVLLGWAG